MRDFPEPVGSVARVFLPAKMFSMISSWAGRNSERPKYFWSAWCGESMLLIEPLMRLRKR